MRPRWLCWHLAPDRLVLELDERLAPPGCALELELLHGGGVAASFGAWRLSETGALLALVRAAEA